MKNSTIVLATTALVLISTNPNWDAYIKWATKNFSAEMQAAICQNSHMPKAVYAKTLTNSCKFSISLLNDLGIMSAAIDLKTQQQNLVLFSIYTTQIPTGTVKTIGVLGNFFVFPVLS